MAARPQPLARDASLLVGPSDEVKALVHARDILARKGDSREDRTKSQAVLRGGGSQAARLVWHPVFDSVLSSVPALRGIDSWKSRSRTDDMDVQRLSLARHVWGRWPVPPFLDRLWANLDAGRRPGNTVPLVANGWLEYASWWAAAASGASLWKLQAREALSRKDLHWFLHSPPSMAPRQAIWRARLIGAGATPGDAGSVASGKFSEVAGAWTTAASASWMSVGRFMAEHRTAPGMREAGDDLLDWVHAMIAADPAWTMRGRTVDTVLRASRQWHLDTARMREWSAHRWDGFPVDDWHEEAGDPARGTWRRWEMCQITTGKELSAEGAAQRHCVGSYLSRCRSGDSAILSLRRSTVALMPQRARALTVELNKGWDVVQARGYANRSPSNEERAVLERWAAFQGVRVVRT